nr:UPF0481 protein At3g47200-like [Ipomoea trifida]
MSLGASYDHTTMKRTERRWNGDHRAIQADSKSKCDDEAETLARMHKRLEDSRGRIEAETLVRMHKRVEDRRRSYVQRTTSSGVECIYRVPPNLTEIVSIGPYHRDRGTVLEEFDNYKWRFLDYVLSFTRLKGNDLDEIVRSMSDLERSARICYSEPTPISSADFIQL